jgi:hypothetical protein
MTDFGDYIIYADESGDHSLRHIDDTYPVFVLCLCLFRKSHYIQRIVPRIQSLKFSWFGHDDVILHERDIRKRTAPFEFLNRLDAYESFMSELSSILAAARIAIVASVIDKRRLKDEYLFHDNPYHLALGFCIESVFQFLEKRGQEDKITHFIFERRGAKEDKDLELEFRRTTGGQNTMAKKLTNFEIRFVDKKANSAGMQLADLTARPIGLRVMRPTQPNRAFDIIAKKLVSSSGKKGTKALGLFP